MVFKNPKIIIIAALFLFWFAPILWAQNSGYFLDTSGEEPRFVQRLSWNEEEYVLQYEVVIEKEGDGEYREFLREFTTAIFIEVSLLPGKYRCHVIPYDFLDQPGEEYEWMYFEVLTALYPEVGDTLFELSHSGTDFQHEDTIYTMRISGMNMIPGAEIYLRTPDGEHIVPSDVYVNEDGSEVQLFFDKDQLIPGDFELIVRNPGGLETSKGGIVFAPPEPAEETVSPKKIELFVSAAWMPLFPIYYEDEPRLSGEKLFPAGAVVRFGVISSKQNALSLGLELAVSWYSFASDGQGMVQFFSPGLNFLVQKWLPSERAALTFRLGAGYGVQFPGNDSAVSFPDLHSVNTNIGISCLWLVMKHWYIETGIDYVHWFSEYPSGCLRPWIGMGLRF
jgi:hypothetical protein